MIDRGLERLRVGQRKITDIDPYAVTIAETTIQGEKRKRRFKEVSVTTSKKTYVDNATQVTYSKRTSKLHYVFDEGTSTDSKSTTSKAMSKSKVFNKAKTAQTVKTPHPSSVNLTEGNVKSRQNGIPSNRPDADPSSNRLEFDQTPMVSMDEDCAEANVSPIPASSKMDASQHKLHNDISLTSPVKTSLPIYNQQLVATIPTCQPLQHRDESPSTNIDCTENATTNGTAITDDKLCSTPVCAGNMKELLDHLNGIEMESDHTCRGSCEQNQNALKTFIDRLSRKEFHQDQGASDWAQLYNCLLESLESMFNTASDRLQVRINRKRKSGVGESNVSGSDTLSIEVHQCNPRNDSKESDVRSALENHQMEEVLLHLGTENPVDPVDNSEPKKRQFYLATKSKKTSLKHNPNGRKLNFPIAEPDSIEVTDLLDGLDSLTLPVSSPVSPLSAAAQIDADWNILEYTNCDAIASSNISWNFGGDVVLAQQSLVPKGNENCNVFDCTKTDYDRDEVQAEQMEQCEIIPQVGENLIDLESEKCDANTSNNNNSRDFGEDVMQSQSELIHQIDNTKALGNNDCDLYTLSRNIGIDIVRSRSYELTEPAPEQSFLNLLEFIMTHHEQYSIPDLPGEIPVQVLDESHRYQENNSAIIVPPSSVEDILNDLMELDEDSLDSKFLDYQPDTYGYRENSGECFGLESVMVAILIKNWFYGYNGSWWKLI
ncbi:hypothetical protein HA402_001581 [Bradysia odoriphaga]|nr:hypothetical protein HA402_001581 [Bradysia odoriphaga]